MKLVLCTRKASPASFLLRTYLWSRWSHAAIYDDERGVVFDATFTHGGCRVWPEGEFFARYPAHELRTIAVDADELPQARLWLDAQLGKSYDWKALAGIFMRREWADEGRWFCSEMAEAFRTQFERRRFLADASRITPEHLAMTV